MDNNEEDNEVSNFNSDNEDEIVEDENNIQNNDIDIIVYNEDIYNFNYIYYFMINKAILSPKLRCPLCNDEMILTNNNSYLDKKCFRCRKNTPKHDIKIPIRKDSFLENIRINLITIYFLIFD